MSATLSIKSNLKPSVDCQDAVITDIFRLIKSQHGVNIRLFGLLFGTIAITKDANSIYADFSSQDKSIAIDADGELDQALSRIIVKEITSMKSLKELLSPTYQSFTSSRLLINIINRQQEKFINKANEIRTYMAEHDIDVENKYSESFSDADDLIRHLNS